MRHYRPDIDGLRALAVLAVVAYHASASLIPGGFVGVDIFFVISGYLITGILLRELGAGEFSIKRFYARRIRRIFPALIVVLVACWAIGWLLLLPEEYKELGKHILSTAGFGSNFVLWKESGYFDRAADFKPLLHMWSLGVEEQFYIAWPLLLAAAWAWRHVGWLLLAVAAASLLACLIVTPHDASAAFYLPLTRFWELALGGLLAHRELRRPLALRRPTFCALVGFGLIGTAFFAFDALAPYPGWRALLPVAGSLLLIASGGSNPLSRYVLGNRLAVAIGLISYPLYLWHWPLLSMARIVNYGEPAVSVRLGALLLALLLAFLTYRYVEQPVRHGRFRKAPGSTRWLIFGMVAVAIMGAVTWDSKGIPALRGNTEMNADLERHDRFRGGQPRCAKPENIKDISWCYLSRQGTPTLALFGDSHADHLLYGLTQNDQKNNWLLIGSNTCPPVLDLHVMTKSKPDYCADVNRRIVDALIDSPNIHIVVLSSFGPLYVGYPVAADYLGSDRPDNLIIESTRPEEAALSKPELYERGTARIIRALQAAGKKVVFFIDTPRMDADPRSCIPRPMDSMLMGGKGVCGITRAQGQASQAEYRAVVARLKQQFPTVRFYDSSSSLCDEAYCYAGKPGELYYHDRHHLSLRGSRAVTKDFLGWLERR